MGSIKGGRIDTIEIRLGPERVGSVFDMLNTERCEALRDFLNPKITLVPIPRSSFTQPGTLWPAKVISDALFESGFGCQVNTFLFRKTPIHKSSLSQSADTRPSVQNQMDSLGVNRDLINDPKDITLIDDVITAGRTSVACALRLLEVFPNSTIRLFAMVRTKSFDTEVEQIVNPETGIIEYYPGSGKTYRKP